MCFIDRCLASIKSIETSLKLLGKFWCILQHGTLRTDLDSKLGVVFHNYGLELNVIQENYAKIKNQPPLARNMPSVAGNIGWAWHLLKRIMVPMQKCHGNPQAFKGNREVRCITRTYNEMAKTIVKFKFLWHTAWTASIEQAMSVL